jgi:diguanylate cyclase (GGDEF)-like protein
MTIEIQPSEDERDDLADRRDIAGECRDRASEDADDIASWRDRLSDHRDHGANKRERGTAAATHRALAKSDREAGAQDRMNAGRDRCAARADRSAAKANREFSAAERNVTSLIELEREMDRTKRTGRPLVLALLDIDGLKGVNEAEGYAAGARLFQAVVHTVRNLLRSYDPIIRYEDDKFLCVLWNIDLEDAFVRFDRVSAVLAQNPFSAPVGIGLAQFELGESVTMLIARADRARSAKLARPA